MKEVWIIYNQSGDEWLTDWGFFATKEDAEAYIKAIAALPFTVRIFRIPENDYVHTKRIKSN